MNVAVRLITLLAVLCGIVACDTPSGMLSAPPALDRVVAKTEVQETSKIWGPGVMAACPDARAGEAQCLALIRTGPQIGPDGGAGPGGGFTPAQLQAAYNLPSASKGSGQLVAIVDAYDDPNVASDLAFYRSYFGLPAANFTKYNQNGQTGNYPEGNAAWAIEESLDVDMVSATCPNCSIDLIEANSQNTPDLETAVTEAVTLGAHIVSNSYGCTDGPSCAFEEKYYNAKGVTYIAASGDFGYTGNTLVPAALGSVISAGGTSLYVDTKTARGFRETAWLGTGSVCSTEKKPTWQHDPGCSYRTGNDVASVSDPATGVAVYDTYDVGGWRVIGGTSTAAPFLSGIFGLAGNASSQRGGETFWKKEHQGKNDLFHITKGYNGSCSPTYLCTDGTHEYRDYGGPTGWGTPNGVGAF